MPKKDPIKSVIRNVRRALNYSGLYEKDISSNPFELFEKWMQAAIDKELFEPNAMTLATASNQGHPTARTVLLKDYSEEGFVFYTNLDSRKGQDLKQNPQASLVFYWGSLSRQVLVDGVVKPVSRDITEEYFHSRPRGSQLAAYASDQSRPLKNREELEERIKKVKAQYKEQEIPCPENWGGYCLEPLRIEFWQGRPDRTHDRICFTRERGQPWNRVRLAP